MFIFEVTPNDQQITKLLRSKNIFSFCCYSNQKFNSKVFSNKLNWGKSNCQNHLYRLLIQTHTLINSNYLLRMDYQRKTLTFLFFVFLFLLVNSENNQEPHSEVITFQKQANNLENSLPKFFDSRQKAFHQLQTSKTQKNQRDSIQTIQNEVSKQNNQPWYVIVAIIGSGLILAVIAIVLYKNLFSKYCCDQNWYYAPQWIEMVPQQLSHEFYSDYLRFLDADDLCSICLNGKCDSITSCGHIFHLQCFLKWLKTDKNCPNCKKEEFSLKYFCSQCKKRYCHLDNMDMIDKCSSYLKEFPKCDTCYEQQLKEQQLKKPVIGIMQFPEENLDIGDIPLPAQSQKQHLSSQSQENLGGYLNQLKSVQNG